LKQVTFILFLIIFSLSSCFKKEDPIILPAGNSEISSVFLGEGYSKSMYFDMGTNTYQEKRWADWDICFDASKEGYGVFINTAKSIAVRNIDLYNLTEKKAIDTNYFRTYPELLEPPEGEPAKSAMGGWKTYTSRGGLSGIYVIELKSNSGYNRFKRLQILSEVDTAYFVRITDLFNANGDTIFNGPVQTIPKNPNQNFTYYSFDNKGHIVDHAEPDKHSWDFVFTRYKHIFYNVIPGQPFPYGPLTGILSNSNDVEVARDSAFIGFENIDASSIPKYTFSKTRNAIGFDWKTHAQGPGGYSIATDLCYIIRDTEGYYYKLRFLDYNNELGQPGYPKFEFIRIK
jgi:hypothetical protein